MEHFFDNIENVDLSRLESVINFVLNNNNNTDTNEEIEHEELEHGGTAEKANDENNSEFVYGCTHYMTGRTVAMHSINF